MKQKGTKNLTYTQRLQIETLFKAKHSAKQIANNLGLNTSTIYKELRRGEYAYNVKTGDWWHVRYEKITSYSADIAQQRYEIVSTSRGRPIKLGNDYEFVEHLTKRVLEYKLSVGAVLGEIEHKGLKFKTHVSKTTVYRYIKLGYIPDLRLAPAKKTYKHVRAKRAPRGTSIEKRSKEILSREEFGHWEMDSVCGSSKCAFLTLSERKTRKVLVFKMERKTSQNVVFCLNVLERRFGKLFRKVFKTITVDNGSEFADFEGMQKSSYGNFNRTEIFYCHPYSACERGTNERLNREIRRQVPKGSDISKVQDVQFVEDWLNDYPRQILGFATSKELFELEMQALQTT